MSRSYRKPYASITGVPRSHQDKTFAARGLRRKQNQWLRTVVDFEDALLPARSQCSWNNTAVWARDGRQSLVFPTTRYPKLTGYFRAYWIQLQRK